VLYDRLPPPPRSDSSEWGDPEVFVRVWSLLGCLLQILSFDERQAVVKPVPSSVDLLEHHQPLCTAVEFVLCT